MALLGRLSFSLTWPFALIGVCTYLLGAGLSIFNTLPLLCLLFFGLLAIAFPLPDADSSHSAVFPAVFFFLVATALSVLASVDPHRSLRLSVALVPGTLLFLLIAHYFRGFQDVRRLCLILSIVSFSLALTVLWAAAGAGDSASQLWVADMKHPLLIVPNDGTFLSLLAPFSLVLFSRATRRAESILAVLFLASTACAVCVLHSRVAVLTLIFSLTCTATLFRPRLGLVVGLGTLSTTLLIDGYLGFPLLEKFGHFRDARISLWLVALSLFSAAPLVGQGPHTFGLFYQPDTLAHHRLAGITVDPHDYVPWAHNLYLELLAEQGLLGFIAFVIVFSSGLRAAWRTRRVGIAEERAFAIGIFSALVGLCFAATVELTLLRQWVVILLFTLLGMAARLAPSRFDPTKEDEK